MRVRSGVTNLRPGLATIAALVLWGHAVTGCGPGPGGSPARPDLHRAPPDALVPADAAPAASAEPPIEQPEPTSASSDAVRFTEVPALRFRRGPALHLTALAKQTRMVALSPDGRSWVVDGPDNTVRLVTPALPQGVTRRAWFGSGLFSEDGAALLIWSSDGLEVLDVATGKTLAKREVPICAARFLRRDLVVAFDESKEPDARMWHIDLRSGAAKAIGSARAAETCRASLDGRAWLIESYDARAFVDGQTGQARPLGKSAGEAILSRAGNRFCVGDGAGLRCVRLPDGRVELVWTRPTADYIVYDITGKKAFVQYADGPDEVRDAFALVDFEAATVQPLPEVRWPSGSTFELGPGGILLTIGGAVGLTVYDLERGQLRFASHAPLYGHYSFPYEPRRIVAGTDEPMDLFVLDVR